MKIFTLICKYIPHFLIVLTYIVKSEVLHIFLGQKIKILETRPDFLTFSAKTHNRF